MSKIIQSQDGGSVVLPDGITTNGTDVLDYETTTVSIGGVGSFTTAVDILFTRIGNTVTITSADSLSHTSSSVPSTGSGFIPAAYRPTTPNILAVSSFNGGVIYGFQVFDNGTLAVVYRSWTGGLTAQTGCAPLTITYNIA